MNVSGLLSLEDLEGLVESGQIKTVVVGFTDLYGRLVGKRFDARFFLDRVAGHGSHACDYLLTVDMEMNPVPGYRFANWDKGYGDMALQPDLSTLRVASWLDATAAVLCDVVDQRSERLLPIAPRSLLRQQIDRMAAAGCSAQAGSELEYYIFCTSYRTAARRRYRPDRMTPAGWYIEDYHTLQGTREEHFHAAARQHLCASGVPVECTKGEWGKGQHELNIRHAGVLAMADNHVLLKQCLKEIAERQKISVTFMAKFDEAWSGSSCHLHLSLWQDQTNAFAGDRSWQGLEVSDVFRWFLAGWMAHAPDLMVLYAPTVNSYKRFRPGSWAPTRIGWSVDNRTASFRVVGRQSSLRIECRIPGADCNPYLAYAAALASGLDGIERQLEPEAQFRGNVYQASQLPELPATLADATQRFAQSPLARAAFGEQVVEHYTHFFRSEQEAFGHAVTDWERWRYFERI